MPSEESWWTLFHHDEKNPGKVLVSPAGADENGCQGTRLLRHHDYWLWKSPGQSEEDSAHVGQRVLALALSDPAGHHASERDLAAPDHVLGPAILPVAVGDEGVLGLVVVGEDLQAGLLDPTLEDVGQETDHLVDLGEVPGHVGVFRDGHSQAGTDKLALDGGQALAVNGPDELAVPGSLPEELQGFLLDRKSVV